MTLLDLAQMFWFEWLLCFWPCERDDLPFELRVWAFVPLKWDEYPNLATVPWPG